MRVVLDTNVIVSAVLFGGLPRECLRRGLSGEFELITSVGLLDELERVLRRLDVPRDAVAFARSDLELASEIVAPTETPTVSRDPADDLVLAVANDGHADHVVTGDQDLLVIGRYGQTGIVTPQEFLRRFPVQSVEK